jgi:hypothetical protein
MNVLYIIACMHDRFLIESTMKRGERGRKCSVGGGLIFFAWKGRR